MRDRYAVWENETTHTFYIEALPNTVQPGKRLLYSGKEYLNFKNKYHAEMLVNMLNGLVDEAGIIEQRVHYWKIEAQTDHGRWLRCLEDLDRLRASSFVTAVPSEEYEKVQAELTDLKAEADRLKSLVGDFDEYLKHKGEKQAFADWEAWRSQREEGGQP
jgi:hypothetical protein